MTSTHAILSAYTRFAAAVQAIPDPKARELHQVALRVEAFVQHSRTQASPPTDDELANGLAEGLLELPLLFDPIDAHWRWAVSRALHAALAAECPDLLAFEAARLQEVTDRGTITSEAEFLLVRHCIDVREGQPELATDLPRLRALLAEYAPLR
ncbi:MAG: hypothetical protein EOO24_48110 [Comamonadaceae bacterium]|nr:MAG: hypothetical protein EOO24_48110 [Comamonadaceae bacterium]